MMMSTNEQDNKTDEIEISEEMINELKSVILEEEQKVLHLRKHGMKDKIIELIKARIK